MVSSSSDSIRCGTFSTQQITLTGVDLTEGGTYTTDQAIIDNLLDKGNLIIDM